MPPTRLITKPFVAVTAAAAAFFVYVGMLVPIIPTFIDDELGAGEIGVGLSLAVVRRRGDLRPARRSAASSSASGRRPVMIGGALARRCRRHVGRVRRTSSGSCSCCAASPASARPPCSSARRRSSPTSRRPTRRAEAASYFSVAVFGGLGVGPIIGDAVLGDDRYARAFVIAGALRLAGRRCSRSGVPSPVERATVTDGSTMELPGAAGIERSSTPPPSAPGWCSRAASPASRSFSAFLPEHARDVGLGGSGGLFAAYSVVCLVLRFTGARWLERLGARASRVDRVRVARPRARRARSSP